MEFQDVFEKSINSKFKIQACDNLIKKSNTFHLIGCYNYTLTCDFRETATISSHPVKQKRETASHSRLMDKGQACTESSMTAKCWYD